MASPAPRAATSRIDSDAGQGHHRLACSSRAREAGAAAEAAPSRDRRAPSRPARRVLLVEDDDGVAELVAEMLSELGYDSLRAGRPAPPWRRSAPTGGSTWCSPTWSCRAR